MNVKGCGNWAELADGIIVGRQQVEGVMLSDRCAARILITLYQSAALLQKEEALAGASPNH